MRANRKQAHELAQFLVARMAHDPEWVGLSSDSMIMAALSGSEPSDRPLDEYDLARCTETMRRAPEWLRELMQPIYDGFVEGVRSGWRA